MSNNFIRIFSIFSKIINNPRSSVSSYDQTINAISLVLVSGVHAIYAYSTDKKEEIQVVEKYKMVNYGYTNFMVVDNKSRHFNVNNSLWFWKWDSIEDWEKIKKGDTLKIKYYGFRLPFLGVFPNIVNSDK